MRSSNELRELAEKVSDTYPDFVRAMQDLGYIHGIEQEPIDYMKESPDAATSDISERQISTIFKSLINPATIHAEISLHGKVYQWPPH